MQCRMGRPRVRDKSFSAQVSARRCAKPRSACRHRRMERWRSSVPDRGSRKAARFLRVCRGGTCMRFRRTIWRQFARMGRTIRGFTAVSRSDLAVRPGAPRRSFHVALTRVTDLPRNCLRGHCGWQGSDFGERGTKLRRPPIRRLSVEVTAGLSDKLRRGCWEETRSARGIFIGESSRSSDHRSKRFGKNLDLRLSLRDCRRGRLD